LLEENFLLRRCSGRSAEPDVFDPATRSAEARASLAVSYPTRPRAGTVPLFRIKRGLDQSGIRGWRALDSKGRFITARCSPESYLTRLVRLNYSRS
jgi:hypothetical protein